MRPSERVFFGFWGGGQTVVSFNYFYPTLKLSALSRWPTGCCTEEEWRSISLHSLPFLSRRASLLWPTWLLRNRTYDAEDTTAAASARAATPFTPQCFFHCFRKVRGARLTSAGERAGGAAAK